MARKAFLEEISRDFYSIKIRARDLAFAENA
jgi:hypothetical protein